MLATVSVAVKNLRLPGVTFTLSGEVLVVEELDFWGPPFMTEVLETRLNRDDTGEEFANPLTREQAQVILDLSGAVVEGERHAPVTDLPF